MQSRTTQFDFMMKAIMVVLFVFGLFIFFVDVTKAADWVNDPNNCPIEYAPEGVSCSGGNVICGVSGAACIDPALIVKKSTDSSGSQSLHSGGFGGGYLVNCTAIRDTDGSPYCDNNSQYWCNRDSSCYNDKIQTICLANTWAGGGLGMSFNCATISLNSNTGCISGYTNCSSTVAGCETPIGTTCSIGGLTGSLNASCSCIVPTQNFVTGIEALFSTTSPLLWGKQFGEGDLLNFGNATSSNIFVVKNDASIFMSSTLATTTEQYFYNYNGDLYWGDTKLGSGGGVYTAGNGLNLNSYEFSVNTSSDFTWAGQHTFNATTTFPLGVWGDSGRVGINTNTLNYILNVQMEVGSYGGFGIYGANGNLLGGFGNQDFTGINSNGAIALYYENSDPSQPHSYFAASGHSFLSSSTLAIGSNTGNDGWNSSLMVEGGIHIQNGVLRFNNVSGTVDQVLRISPAGFPEWVDVDTLFTNNTIFNSSTEFYSTSTFNSSSIFNDTTEFNSTSTFNSVAIFNNPTIFNDNVFVSGTIYSDNLTVYGTTTLNDIYVTGQAIFHDILPEHNLAYTIGTSTLVWKEGWFGKIFTDEIEFVNNWKLTTTTVAGGLAFVSSTQVALAMLATGQVGINTTTIEANLQMKVDGNIGSRMYCDVNGENCFDPSLGWVVPITDVTTTPVTNNGDFTSGTMKGYQAANAICDYHYPGYHFCFSGEIISFIRTGDISKFVGLPQAWIAEGPPGYTAYANDCGGYTTSSIGYLGAFWEYNGTTGGGQGWLSNCSSNKAISCCK